MLKFGQPRTTNKVRIVKSVIDITLDTLGKYLGELNQIPEISVISLRIEMSALPQLLYMNMKTLASALTMLYISNNVIDKEIFSDHIEGIIFPLKKYETVTINKEKESILRYMIAIVNFRQLRKQNMITEPVIKSNVVPLSNLEKSIQQHEPQMELEEEEEQEEEHEEHEEQEEQEEQEPYFMIPGI